MRSSSCLQTREHVGTVRPTLGRRFGPAKQAGTIHMRMKIGGVTMKTRFLFVLATIGTLGMTTPALATNDSGDRPMAPVTLFRDMALATIEVAKEAMQATSDTVHHNIGNVINTAARARGFVRDSVGGMLDNARRLSGVMGEMMPLTTHNHHENRPSAESSNKTENAR